MNFDVARSEVTISSKVIECAVVYAPTCIYIHGSVVQDFTLLTAKWKTKSLKTSHSNGVQKVCRGA